MTAMAEGVAMATAARTLTALMLALVKVTRGVATGVTANLAVVTVAKIATGVVKGVSKNAAVVAVRR